MLSRMASDDAADLLLEIDQDRRLPILDLLPPAKQRKIRSLLGYNPSTAGGIMNPDFVSVGADATVGDALAAVRATELGQQPGSIVCVLGDHATLLGALSLTDLVRVDPQERASKLIENTPIPTVSAEADIPEVATLMSDYNLIAMPVLDGDGKPVGVISVDDVLELLIPEEWRWRAGAARS